MTSHASRTCQARSPTSTYQLHPMMSTVASAATIMGLSKTAGCAAEPEAWADAMADFRRSSRSCRRYPHCWSYGGRRSSRPCRRYRCCWSYRLSNRGRIRPNLVSRIMQDTAEGLVHLTHELAERLLGHSVKRMQGESKGEAKRVKQKSETKA